MTGNFRKGNLVDQMIRMSEKYADELEQMVAIRTADLADAQMQTMRLLNEMLPAWVVCSNWEALHWFNFKEHIQYGSCQGSVIENWTCQFVIRK